MTRRLLIGFLALTSVVLLLLIVPLGVSSQRSEREDLTRRIERDAVAAASQSESALAATTNPARARSLTALRTRLAEYSAATDARVLVTDRSGRSVVDTGEPDRDVELGRDFSTRPEVERALRGEIASGERSSATLGHPLLFVTVPVTSAGRVIGAARVSYPSDELDERVATYWTGLASVALLVLGISSVLALVAARWIARPLESIARVATDVGSGDLEARADASSGPPEVRVVAAQLNDSIAALQRLIDDQRAFTADVAHQLRTPLQAMMIRLDNVQHALDGGSTDAAHEDTERAAGEVERLAAMVDALLVLERADRGGSGEPGVVDVSELLNARSADWRELGARRGVAVDVDRDDRGLQIHAHAVHVEQVLDNYVDNAVSVSPDGSTVRVRARLDDAAGMVELHVVDEGPGLDDAQLETVFRRFASGAERRRDGHGGFGLGLAIVRRLAEVDDGRAWLRHGPGRGIDAVVAYRSVTAPDD